MLRINECFKDKKKCIIYVSIAIVSIALALAYFFVTYHLVLRTDFDSDYANLVLEASDIASGNVFLKGWNQTGVSFLLTDLLYFVVGVLVFGVSKTSYAVAMTLMIVCAAVTAFFLTDYKNIKNNILYFSITAFPTVTVVALLRAHTGGYVLTFIVLIIIAHCLKNMNISWKSSALMILPTAMCAMSDAASLVFGAGSILVLCIYKLVFDKDCNKKFYIKLFAVIMAGTILGFTMDKLYYIIGGANKNGFLELKAFVAVEDIFTNLCTYIEAVFTLGNASIFGKSIFDLETIIACTYIPFVLIGCYLVFKNIKMFLKNENEDLISCIISVGFVLVSLVFIFTTVGIDIFSSRYFATLPFFFSVLICRYIKNYDIYERLVHISKIRYKYVIVVAAFVYLIGGSIVAKRHMGYGEYVIEQEVFVEFLEQNNLTNGYANYWDSSIVTVASNGKVHLSQVQMDGVAAYPFKWFCKNEWYYRPANFVAVYDPEKDDYGVTPENTIGAFGEPSEKLYYGDFTIYKYNYDISTELIKLD